MADFKALKLQQVLQKKREEQEKIKEFFNKWEGKWLLSNLHKIKDKSIAIQTELKDSLPF